MLTTLEFSSRLLLALTLGAGIGIERQWRQRIAGLRTNTLVLLGKDIEQMKDTELSDKLTDTSIFTKLSPIQKSRVVHSLQL